MYEVSLVVNGQRVEFKDVVEYRHDHGQMTLTFKDGRREVFTEFSESSVRRQPKSVQPLNSSGGVNSLPGNRIDS